MIRPQKTNKKEECLVHCYNKEECLHGLVHCYKKEEYLVHCYKKEEYLVHC